MRNVLYKHILRDAWIITIKNKFLWLLGLVASFIAFEGIYESLFARIVQIRQPRYFYIELMGSYQEKVSELLARVNFINLLSQDFTAFCISVLMLALFLIVLWFIIIAHITIIAMAEAIYAKKKLRIGEAFEHAQEKFLSVFSVVILGKALAYIIFIALSIPLFYFLFTNRSGMIVLFNALFLVGFTVASIIIGFLTMYASNYIILREQGIKESIGHAWKLFRKNVVTSLEVAGILFLVRIVSMVIIFSITFLVTIPIMAFFLISLANQSLLGTTLSIVVFLLAFTIISLVINAIYTTLYLSAWTIAFINLAEDSLMSKITKAISLGINKVKTLAKKSPTLTKLTDTELRNKLQAHIAASSVVAKVVTKKYADKALVSAKETYRKYSPTVELQVKKFAREILADVKETIKEEVRKAKKSPQKTPVIKKGSAQKKPRPTAKRPASKKKLSDTAK